MPYKYIAKLIDGTVAPVIEADNARHAHNVYISLGYHGKDALYKLLRLAMPGSLKQGKVYTQYGDQSCDITLRLEQSVTLKHPTKKDTLITGYVRRIKEDYVLIWFTFRYSRRYPANEEGTIFVPISLNL